MINNKFKKNINIKNKCKNLIIPLQKIHMNIMKKIQTQKIKKMTTQIIKFFKIKFNKKVIKIQLIRI